MKPTPTSEAGGADWRQRFTDYKTALASHQRAQGWVDELEGRLTACTTQDERAAIGDGVTLAKRRLRLTGENLASATDAFAQGRSVVEAIWNAPDDI